MCEEISKENIIQYMSCKKCAGVKEEQKNASASNVNTIISLI
jgi:hypothetical protein